jgi:hypothetical protein
MLNRKKNHGFCKCISMDFGNDLQFLQMDFKFLEMHFQEFCKWIFNFGKWISKILEMHFQFLEMARNFYCATFFGHIFNRNNPTFIKARILRKEYFNRPRFCFLDFTITSNLEKYF